MAKQEKRNRVWILGAGFSRSLGGPLMGDLLSLAARRMTLATYPHQFTHRDADLIYWLFHCGAAFPEGPLDPDLKMTGERRWRDAEQFLELLDNARNDPSKERIVRDVLTLLRDGAPGAHHEVIKQYPSVFDTPFPNTPTLFALARRVVAASCATFVEGVTPEGARKKERWLPYQRWMSCLRETDSILTFNYDRVVELLEPVVDGSVWGVHVAGVRKDEEREAEAHAAQLATLYKLHGSVDWTYDGKTVTERKWAPDVLDGRNDLAIATPGDSKMEMAGGIFTRLWKEAGDALREADDVFIIGFRFPESDAYPRDRLLGALAENPRKLNVHLVLGPQQSDDLRRVLSLLSWTFPNIEVRERGFGDFQSKAVFSHALWAEDFLAAWARLEKHRMDLAPR